MSGMSWTGWRCGGDERSELGSSPSHEARVPEVKDKGFPVSSYIPIDETDGLEMNGSTAGMYTMQRP